MSADAKEKSEQFGLLNKQINSVYAEYARSLGLSYTSLYILHLITLTKGCTQKIIIKETMLPKQTVNSVISSFRKEGILTLVDSPSDKREKVIALTEKGQKLASSLLPKITDAEEKSMEIFSEEERRMFLEFMEKYAEQFAKAMKVDK